MEALPWVALLNTTAFLVALNICVQLRLSATHPLCLFVWYFLVGYVARPLVLIQTGYSQLWSYIGFDPTNRELVVASVYASIALLCVLLTPAVVSPGLFTYRVIPRTKLIVGHPSRFWLAVASLVMLGLLAVSRAHSGAADLAVVGYEVEVDSSGGQRLSGISGYETAASEFLPATILIIALCTGVNAKLMVLLVPFIALRFWMGAGRNAFFLLALALISVHLMQSGRRFPTIKFILAGVLALFSFDIVGSNRLAARQIITGDLTFLELLRDYQHARGENKLTSDFAEFEVSSAIIAIVPEKTGYNWFSQYLRIIVWPIPRQIWEDKPVYTSFINLNEVGNYFALTWSLIADMYSNFGVASLLLGSALLGILLVKVNDVAARTSSPYAYSMAWMFMMYLPLLFRDGPPMFIYMTGFACVAACILCWSGQCRLSRESPSDSSI